MFSSSFEDGYSFIPTVYTDGNLKIIGLNSAAAHFGVRAGEILHIRTDTDVQKFRHGYEAYTAGMSNASADTHEGVSGCVRIPLSSFHGFRTALVRFEYSLTGTFAAVMLFRTQKDYLRTAPQYTKYYQRSAQLFTGYFDRLREICAELLSSPDASREELAASLDELLAAIQLSARLLSPFAADSGKKKRLFSLSSLLDTYFSSILPRLKTVDCEIDRADDTTNEELLFPVDIGAIFLLLTTLFGLLNSVSSDGKILVTKNRYGQDGEIRLSTTASPSVSPLLHTFDLSAIATAFPQAEMSCSAAEYLAEITDTYIDLFTNDANGRVTLSLYLPFEKQTADFKSPKGADEDIREAIRCMHGFFFLDGIFTAQSAVEAE